MKPRHVTVYLATPREVEREGLFDVAAIAADRSASGRAGSTAGDGWPFFVTERDEALRLLPPVKEKEVRVRPNLYEARLDLDGDAVFFLDKPYAQQSGPVRGALMEAGYRFDPQDTGKHIYEHLRESAHAHRAGLGGYVKPQPSRSAANELLQVAGIVAIHAFHGLDGERYESARAGDVQPPRDPEAAGEFWSLFEEDLMSGYVVLDASIVSLIAKNGREIPPLSPQASAAAVRSYYPSPDAPERKITLP